MEKQLSPEYLMPLHEPGLGEFVRRKYEALKARDPKFRANLLKQKRLYGHGRGYGQTQEYKAKQRLLERPDDSLNQESGDIPTLKALGL